MYLKCGLIRGVAIVESGFWLEWPNNRGGLIRGVALGESGLIRGVALGESVRVATVITKIGGMGHPIPK